MDNQRVILKTLPPMGINGYSHRHPYLRKGKSNPLYGFGKDIKPGLPLMNESEWKQFCERRKRCQH